MPELPEVEHTKRNLDRWMFGGVLREVITTDARIVRPSSPSAFVQGTSGRRVAAIERRGKWLKLGLETRGRSSPPSFLFVHLGMTGWFELDMPESPRKFARVTFEVVADRSSRRVVYVDARRWGRMVLANEDIPAWTELGDDPLDDGIDLALFGRRLARRSRSTIKEALLDQSILAGVGNIQSIEALWKAEIDPRSIASALLPKDVAAIASALRWSIKRTLADLAKGEDGADNPFRVYGRKGSPCPRCGVVLERVELAGRTTTFCPGCQVRKPAEPRVSKKRATKAVTTKARPFQKISKRVTRPRTAR